MSGPVEVRYACYVGTGFKQQECTLHQGPIHWKLKGFLWAHRNQGREAAVVFSSEGGGTYEVIRAHPHEYEWVHHVIDCATGDTVSKSTVERFVSEPNY